MAKEYIWRDEVRSELQVWDEGCWTRYKMLEEYIKMNCPESRERDLALAKILKAVKWAIVAIARNKIPAEEGE